MEQQRGLVCRLVEGAKNSGPGWLLSAYTLGSGTALSTILAGSQYGYDLLWVNPLAMLIGCVVLSGAAYFALSSDKSPFCRFKTELNPALAYAWGIGSLLASIVWHLPQYGITYAAIRELGGFAVSPASQFAVGGIVLVISTALTWQYKRGGSGMLIYETVMKFFVWMTVICLFILMFKLDIDWGAVVGGLVSFRMPAGSSIFIFGLLGAAVGINMTFLYPYSVRCKGWTAKNAGIARRDLLLGMFLPFIIATGMLTIAAAATLHGQTIDTSKITQIAHVFTPAFGPSIGPRLFLLGLLAMPLGTITLHMLTCGFIISEMTGAEQGSGVWKIGTLIPAIGVIGVAYPLPIWLPVPTSALCLILLPIAYIGFLLLFKRDLGRPDAAKFRGAGVQLALTYAAIAVITLAAAMKLKSVF